MKFIWNWSCCWIWEWVPSHCEVFLLLLELITLRRTTFRTCDQIFEITTFGILFVTCSQKNKKIEKKAYFCSRRFLTWSKISGPSTGPNHLKKFSNASKVTRCIGCYTDWCEYENKQFILLWKSREEMNERI